MNAQDHPRTIANKARLIRNGGTPNNRKARRLTLFALERALAAIDPYRVLKTSVRLEDGVLLTDRCRIKLSSYRRILALAVGKASVPMMTALREILATFPNLDNILVVPKNQKHPHFDPHLRIFPATHPIPNRDGLRAAGQLGEAVRSMRKEDLLICMISGGASALLPSPPPGISLHDERTLTKQLLRRKVNIHEINTIRRHISTLKGGRLVEQCPARILSLIISDVPGNNLPDIASGMTVEDPTTYKDAVKVLKSHHLWRRTPDGIKRNLSLGIRGEIPETPKPGNPCFRRVSNVILADNMTACQGAKRALIEKGVRASVLTASAEIEAEEMGQLLSSWAINSKSRNSSRPSEAAVMGGETVVHVRGKGRGGRNHETILCATQTLAGLDGVAVAALGTDGVDGNCKAAGALADGMTSLRAERKDLRPREFLARNDSYTFFRALSDSLVTGPTGTNVGDLYLAVSVR